MFNLGFSDVVSLIDLGLRVFDLISLMYILLPLDTLEWLVFGGAFRNTTVVNLAIDPHLEHGAYYIDQCLVERLKNTTVD